MRKRIKVIKLDGKFLCYFRLNEYQEPVMAWDTDIFQALDIDRYHRNMEDLWRECIINLKGTIEQYEIIAVELN